MNDIFKARTEAVASTLKFILALWLGRIKEATKKKPVTIDGTFIYVSSNATVNQLFKQIDNPNPTHSRIYGILKINNYVGIL